MFYPSCTHGVLIEQLVLVLIFGATIKVLNQCCVPILQCPLHNSRATLTTGQRAHSCKSMFDLVNLMGGLTPAGHGVPGDTVPFQPGVQSHVTAKKKRTSLKFTIN